jgi:lipopolysaccharide transport system ATP-binding protein
VSAIAVSNLGKAYKQYSSKWARLIEWLTGRQRHKNHWVLSDINFSLAPGDTLGVVGVNGAGKSTLLKIITGTTLPTTGSVRVRGRVAALLELGMGFHPDFTGRQNVFIAGQIQGLTVPEIEHAFDAITAFADIGSYMDEPVRIYSSGMQMRLAFSVAIAVRPDILIVDEALAVGDAHFQAKCFQRISEFRALGTTLLLVSHSVEDIVKHCDRAILLMDGKIEQYGSARMVTNRYLDALFGKQARLGVGEPAEASAQDVDLLPGLADEYHTRPGYHSTEHRWGQGGGAILDYLIVSGNRRFPSRIEGNAQADFYFKVRFDRDFENVVPGLLIKTLEGIFLYGTNSMIAGNACANIPVRTGDVRVFKFSASLSLTEANYLVSFGVSFGTSQHDLVPIDRRYDSVIIHVGRNTEFSGIVDLEASFQVCHYALPTADDNV